MLSGDNSILQRATDAKIKSDEAQIKERIQLAYHSALTGGQGSYTKDTLMAELKKEFETDYDVDDSDNKNWKMKAHGQEIIIPAGKEDNSKITIKVGTTNLKEVSNLTTLYGETTDFTSVDGVEWQLFYDDTDYIYIIAKDYVSIETLPSELVTQEGQYTPNTPYCKAFSAYDVNANPQYFGTIMENTPWSNGAESNTITENSQTNKYLKWVNSSLATTKNNLNMKAVAYMMDTSKWRNFAGNTNGVYAIGGPTLEMFTLSYNAKHDTKLGTYGTSAEDITSTNADTNGYKVKSGTDSWAIGVRIRYIF